ncbi:MAG: 3-isopropylmalate dehydratase small subunit [Alphaproteobacteria bacterium]|nr:3-isopropylmalate dehydratase small subunit [Alphaproteobacteria bacterium]
MQKVTTITGTSAFLPIANIDTDMIIPKQYLKTIKRSGLGQHLFAEMRYDAQGNPKPDFILNQKPQASILLAGENFGCGSSREHAPWSLYDFGIRAVIAPDFADIFYNNSIKNGLLPIRLPMDAVQALSEQSQPITIDLAAQKVICGNMSFEFTIEPNHKNTLLNGMDAIAHVLQYKDDIRTFEQNYLNAHPWLVMKDGKNG